MMPQVESCCKGKLCVCVTPQSPHAGLHTVMRCGSSNERAATDKHMGHGGKTRWGVQAHITTGSQAHKHRHNLG